MTTPWTSQQIVEPTESGPLVEIVIRPINFDDQSAVYTQEGTGADTFADYKIVNRYWQDPKTYMAGISSPGGFAGASVAFFQLASATTLWIADWTASKLNSAPEAPNPILNNSSWVYLGALMEPVKIDYMGDGLTPIYRLSGMYIYGKKNPNAQLALDINFPRSPEFDDASPRNMPLDKLKQGFIDKGDSGGAPSFQGGTYQGPVTPGQ